MNWRRVIPFIGFSVISTAFGIYCGDTLRCSEKALDYIGTIYSILAGTLFAVISIIGDPSMLLSGNWRVARVSAERRQRDILGFNFLFCSYLITLGLLVICAMIKHEEIKSLYFSFHLLGFFTAFSFLWSFRIPFRLQQIQKLRLEDEIKSRKPEQ